MNVREAVRNTFDAAASDPAQHSPYPFGRNLALAVGYPESILQTIPELCVEVFAGVTNLSLSAELALGESVLDLGCGAGLDSFIAADRVGPSGSVVGVDFSSLMLARAEAARNTRAVTFVRAGAEQLPLPGDRFDVVLANGLLNLNPARETILSEVRRVLRPGGRAYLAELISVGAPTGGDWFT
jgi:arsenite methyltransferase